MRRETGKRWTVEVRQGEGVANVPAPSDARVVREGRLKAFTGKGAGEVLSGVGQARGAVRQG